MSCFYTVDVAYIRMIFIEFQDNKEWRQILEANIHKIFY